MTGMAATRPQEAADALLARRADHGEANRPLPTQASAGRTTPPQSGNGKAPDKGATGWPAGRCKADEAPPAVAPAPTDWLSHNLRIQGPAEDLAAFRAAASGAGIIPWHLDLDRVEEDAFLRLAAPTGQTRTLSLEGARLLAAELRDAVARRHALAIAAVGHSHACVFDLHALLPVPGEMLRLGPDHPDALRWLWTHWGTTEALRRVALAPDRDETAPEQTVVRISFWAADWTPWRGLAALRARFSGLRFDVQPHYERA